MLTKKIVNGNDFLDLLDRACKRLDIDHGRAKDYIRLSKEHESFDNEKLTREHILAHNESWEIDDIYELWNNHIKDFPGIDRKIKTVFKKGPVLREDEVENGQVKSSSTYRNNAFTYLLAGKLISCNIKVASVDGISHIHNKHPVNVADITIDWNSLLIDIECKRPQKKNSLIDNLEKACKQILGRNRIGIVGIDCSPFIRPDGTLINKNSAEEAKHFLSEELEEAALPDVRKCLSKKTDILGVILFARAPYNETVKVSPVLHANGRPFTEYRAGSVTTYLCVNNSDGVKNYRNIIDSIYKMLNN